LSDISARDRLVSAAMSLFEEHGYDAVTMDAIAARAGVGRTTLFRLFGSKEGLIFPDHDALLQQLEQRLAAAPGGAAALSAVIAASNEVFAYYLREGELARARYRLTSTVSALRDREIASVGRYIQLFRQYLVAQSGDDSDAALRADLIATAVVTAHNHVLRRWLRGEIADPEPELTDAMAMVSALFGRLPEHRTAVLAFETDEPLESVLPRLRHVLAQPPG
jgi:AcrR family transcriptional regulator